SSRLSRRASSVSRAVPARATVHLSLCAGPNGLRTCDSSRPARGGSSSAAILARRGGHSGDASGHVSGPSVFSLIPGGITPPRSTIDTKREARNRMSILWIILIVILVLALLGFFSRGRW